MHLERRVGHGLRVQPHAARADLVVVGLGEQGYGVLEPLVGEVGPRHHLGLHPGPQRPGRVDPPRHPHRAGQPNQVGLAAEVVGIDQRRRARVGAAQAQRAARQRPDQAGQHHHHARPVGVGDLPRVAMDEGHLDVRPGPAWLRLVEQRRLAHRHGRIRDPLAGDVDYRHEHVVVEILPDAGKVVQHRDAEGGEPRAVADAGQHQELRRVDRTGADHHLAARADAHRLSLPNHLHPVAAPPLERQPRRLRRVDQRDVAAARQGRIQVGRRHVVALAVLDVQVVPAHAFHLRAVEVVRPREAEFEAGVVERLGGGVRLMQPDRHHAERPAVAGNRAGVVLLVFQLLEIRQDVVVAPARGALVGPGVEVRAVPADVHHDVEVAGAAGQPPARFGHAPTAELRLRHALVAPVHRRLLNEGPVPGDGDVLAHVRRNVAAAGLHHRDGDVGVLAQPGGDDAAGSAGANDDVVVSVHGPRSLSTAPRPGSD